MKKNISIFIIGLSLWIASYTFLYANDELCGTQVGYELYECRVKNICNPYTSPKPTYNIQNYQNSEELIQNTQAPVSLDYEFEKAQELYRENMGNIYKCAIIQSQTNTLNFLQDQLKIESSGELSDTIGGRISSRIYRLELSANTLNCVLTDTQSIQNKLNILKESSHELCRYTSYLEYLKDFYNDFEILSQRIGDENTRIPNILLPDIINQIQQDIAVEISHTYKVFPLAYQSYTQYENYFPLHFMLEVLRSDFALVRNRFYGVLMPLAQLGYKVINAMSF